MNVRTRSLLETIRVRDIADEIVAARCGNCDHDIMVTTDGSQYGWVTCDEGDDSPSPCRDDSQLYDLDDTILAIKLW